ncbi:MAG TPA: hypothetical protein VGD45_02525 [Steroidobacter sp.]|uniref:hypothetical protein n=1 Tax=Steroidobacter sp. TaxID=1978227 RepID=UPI002EDAE392
MRAVTDDARELAPPRLCVTSVAYGELSADEECTIGDSSCPCKRLLLVEWLVQRFAVTTHYVPETARRLLTPADLPPALERVAMRAQRCLQAWFAWTDGPRIWFVVAEMATVPGWRCEERAVRMFFYDDDGRFVSWGTWASLSESNWMLCER